MVHKLEDKNLIECAIDDDCFTSERMEQLINIRSDPASFLKMFPDDFHQAVINGITNITYFLPFIKNPIPITREFFEIASVFESDDLPEKLKTSYDVYLNESSPLIKPLDFFVCQKINKQRQT